MLVVGSVAAKVWMPDFREPADTDIWIPKNRLEEFYNLNKNSITKFSPQRSRNKFFLIIDNKKVELGLYDELSPHYLILSAQKHNLTINLFGFEFVLPSPKSLLMIKKSHLHFPIKWAKHIEDYTFIKQRIENILWSFNSYQDDVLLDKAYIQLYNSTKERLNKKTKPNLNMSNEEFFNRSQKSLGRKYIHDDIHKAIAFNDEPMYAQIKEDQSLAKCDKTLWDNLNNDAKVQTVQEEAFVIALERYLIPRHESIASISAPEAYSAFLKALEKITTTLSSGWFRDFIIENWAECKKLNVNYIHKFVEALQNNKVGLYG